jgi:hypothetical protein
MMIPLSATYIKKMKRILAPQDPSVLSDGIRYQYVFSFATGGE